MDDVNISIEPNLLLFWVLPHKFIYFMFLPNAPPLIKCLGLSSNPISICSSLTSALRMHRAAVATPVARFMSTHAINAACEDHEPGFLGSVETFYDRVSLL